MPDPDLLVRNVAFGWLSEQVELHDDVLPRDILARGLAFQGKRVPLVGPQGIFKPALMSLPLSITTVADGPYSDSFRPDGLFNYKYRGTDPNHHENIGLRELMRRRIPLIYFHALIPGKYLALWPVFIVGDDPAALTFTVAVDDALSLARFAQDAVLGVERHESEAAIRRGYITVLAKRRIHQRAFRERVIIAYPHQCALCRLRHEELLDAAHIAPDSDPEGEPVIPNGIALCKLHHAAFDKYFLSVRPDLRHRGAARRADRDRWANAEARSTGTARAAHLYSGEGSPSAGSEVPRSTPPTICRVAASMIVVTSGTFTPDAMRFASSTNTELIDGRRAATVERARFVQ